MRWNSGRNMSGYSYDNNIIKFRAIKYHQAK